MRPERVLYDAHYDDCLLCQRRRRCSEGTRLWAAWVGAIGEEIDAEIAA